MLSLERMRRLQLYPRAHIERFPWWGEVQRTDSRLHTIHWWSREPHGIYCNHGQEKALTSVAIAITQSLSASPHCKIPQESKKRAPQSHLIFTSHCDRIPLTWRSGTNSKINIFSTVSTIATSSNTYNKHAQWRHYQPGCCAIVDHAFC